MLSLIPLTWKIGAGIGLLLALFGGYEAFVYHERALGAARVEAADAKALAKQLADDKALSDSIVAKQQIALSALESKSATIVTRYRDAPKTNTCGPTVHDSSLRVRDIIQGGSASHP